MRIEKLPKDDGSNGWYNILPPAPPARRVSGQQGFDYVVVGAGFAGLAAARRLAEQLPETEIALIEAERVGYGASGRNSGFVIDLPHNVSASDHAKLAELGRREMRLNKLAIDWLSDLVEKHQIQCQWSRRGKIHAAIEDKGVRDLEKFKASLDQVEADYTELDAAVLRARLGTDYYRAGIHTPGCILMQPAALTRGLGAALPPNVSLLEESPVVEIDYGAEIELTCPEGAVRTKQLLLATNGFTMGFGFEKNRLIPVMTFGSLTRPLGEAERQALGGEPDWGIIPGEHLGTTLRYTQDHRLLIRNTFAYTPDFSYSRAGLARMRKLHKAAFEARFPMLPEVGFEHTWGGVLTFSRNHAPCFGRLADNVWSAACQNGVGAAKGTYQGRLLADLIVGAESDHLRDMLAHDRPAANIPQPFLGFGVRARIAFEQSRAGRER